MARIPIRDNYRAIAIRELFKELLSSKHLYQSLELNTDYFEKLIRIQEDSRATPDVVRNLELKELRKPWSLKANSSEANTALSEHVAIPNITTYCHKCSQTHPFRSTSSLQGPVVTFASQHWLMSFECQGCQSATVDFLVTRKELKLTITGRSPLESVSAPSVIPKKLRDRYANAIIANNAGQVLASLFLLRVFIEEFWRSTTAVQALFKTTPKPTGDAMGEAYKDTLPSDFKSRFPTLLEVYNELSAAMHEAKDDAELFQTATGRIIEHFDARRLYKLN